MQTVSARKGNRVRQRGQGMTEYIIITALIAIAAIAAVSYFGGTVRAQVGGMAQELGGSDGTSTINAATSKGNKSATEAVKKHTLADYGTTKDIK